jgi:hypothetical protein
MFRTTLAILLEESELHGHPFGVQSPSHVILRNINKLTAVLECQLA